MLKQVLSESDEKYAPLREGQKEFSLQALPKLRLNRNLIVVTAFFTFPQIGSASDSASSPSVNARSCKRIATARSSDCTSKGAGEGESP